MREKGERNELWQTSRAQETQTSRQHKPPRLPIPPPPELTQESYASRKDTVCHTSATAVSQLYKHCQRPFQSAGKRPLSLSPTSNSMNACLRNQSTLSGRVGWEWGVGTWRRRRGVAMVGGGVATDLKLRNGHQLLPRPRTLRSPSRRPSSHTSPPPPEVLLHSHVVPCPNVPCGYKWPLLRGEGHLSPTN